MAGFNHFGHQLLVAGVQGATDGLGGRRLWQRLVIDDSGSGKQLWGGDFAVRFP